MTPTVPNRSVRVDFDLEIPMADGARLAADLYRPAAAGRRPVVILRTPYDRRLGAATGQQVNAVRLASKGYAVLIQDVRGRFGSHGDFYPFVREGEDGKATVEWASEQSWSTGRVGMVGTSYAGYSQVLAAKQLPESLRAWVPGFAPLDARDGWVYEGDAFSLGFNLSWTLGAILGKDSTTEYSDLMAEVFSNWRKTVRSFPGEGVPLEPAAARYYRDWLERKNDSRYWESLSGRGAGESIAPSLQIGGWFDLFNCGTFDLHCELANGAAGQRHRLVVGPWDHSPLPLGTGSGDSDFGPAAAFDLIAAQRQWFDWLLYEESEPDWPSARIFLTGWNRWEQFDWWPPSAERLDLYLAPDGQLSETPTRDGVDLFVTDPNDPTPTIGGRLCCAPYLQRPGQLQQTSRAQRRDVLRYVSEPTDRELLLAGPVSAVVWSTSDLNIADVHVTLVNICPDGRDLYLADSVRRQAVQPGIPSRFQIQMGQVGHVVLPGHRIALDVAGMSFPRFDRTPSDSVANRVVHLGGGTPSVLHLSGLT